MRNPRVGIKTSSATAPLFEAARVALDEIRFEKSEGRSRGLLLPGALFVAIGAELLPAFMFIDLRFTTLLQ